MNFTATTDSAGNVTVPTITTANNLILSCVCNQGYCILGFSGSNYAVKVVSNNNPLTPVVNKSVTFYVAYSD